MFETVLMVCAQVATAATFSAAWLEALRMMLAGLEQPQGGVAIPLGSDFRGSIRTSAVLLLGAGLSAVFAGKDCMKGLHMTCL